MKAVDPLIDQNEKLKKKDWHFIRAKYDEHEFWCWGMDE